MHLVIALLSLSLLSGLLFFIKKDCTKGILLTKPSLSALFVIAALTADSTNPAYYNPVLAGLLFCAAGDVLLIFRAKQMFLIGLLSFLVGHLFYILAFFSMAYAGLLTWIAAAFCVAVGGKVFFRLRTYWGAMRIPVIAYMVVISAMVIGAASLASNAQVGFTGRVLVFCGAALFYFSDFLVARQRFVKKQYINQLAALPMYYTGQFMIAGSLHFI